MYLQTEALAFAGDMDIYQLHSRFQFMSTNMKYSSLMASSECDARYVIEINHSWKNVIGHAITHEWGRAIECVVV